MRRKFSVISLGCFRNTYDSEIMTDRFHKEGYVLTGNNSYGPSLKNNPLNCDTLLINTCGFIDKAKEESLEVIKQAISLKKKNKVRKIIVFGCLVQRYRDILRKSFPQVDKWEPVVEFSPTFLRRKKLERTYFDFLKICEGCMNKCSFCSIPLIKGGLRSKYKDEIIKEAKFLDGRNTKELNIIGQDITSWGKDLRTGDNLTDLLKSILRATTNIRWLRLIYTHPRNFSDSLIELIAKEKRICKYIDLPIQHINDRILKLMNRGITRKEIESLIRKIRKKIPGCILRTTVIAGFPTEREDEFKELLSFLKDVRFERLGAFIYSREEGTSAYNLSPQIHPSTKKRRYNGIMSQQQKIAEELNRSFIGKKMNILIEAKERDFAIGRTQYDAPEVDGLVFVKKPNLKIGEFYKARIVDIYGYDLIGI